MSVEQDLFSDDMQKRVCIILSTMESVKDCDKTLWFVYCQTYCDLDNAVRPDRPFYNWLMSKQVPTFESLSRCRRKLQEKYPQLRGSKYKEKRESAQRIAERINVD